MTPEGAPAPGNPFGDSVVYSYGHRNVQGLAWDAAGRLYASEFGQNRLRRAQPDRGRRQLRLAGGGGSGGDDGRFADPLATWAHRRRVAERHRGAPR